MANVLYGISGEGFGHTSRSMVAMAHLQQQGHRVLAATYGQALEPVAKSFDLVEVPGLTIEIGENRVKKWRTLKKGAKTLGQALEDYDALAERLVRSWRPDIVVTDFEPVSALMAQRHRLPLVTLDNQHRLRYAKLKVPLEFKSEFLLAKQIVRAIVPQPTVSLITSFHPIQTKRPNAFAFSALVRPEVKALTARSDEHVLVYMTKDFQDIVAAMNQAPETRFIVYGIEPTPSAGSHIEFRRKGAPTFLQDLASAKAVVGTAGFTLISEALHLRKPYLAFPIRGQFEQRLNALELERSGLGMAGSDFTVETLRAFLEELPKIQLFLDAQTIEGPQPPILAKLDDTIAYFCGG